MTADPLRAYLDQLEATHAAATGGGRTFSDDLAALLDATPALLSVVRDLVDLADELEREAEHSGPAKGAAYRIAVDRIRAVLSRLTPEGDVR